MWNYIVWYSEFIGTQRHFQYAFPTRKNGTNDDLNKLYFVKIKGKKAKWNLIVYSCEPHRAIDGGHHFEFLNQSCSLKRAED